MSIIKMPSLAPIPLKLVVVGDDAAGKATLLITYVSGSYPKDYTPTVFDNYSVNVQVDDKQYELGLWETACQEDYDRLRPLSYSQVDVFLVVFSVSNPASFQHVTSKWIPEVMHHCPNVPIVIAGTKIDERDNPEILARLTEKAQSAISMEQGRELAKLVSAAAYVECSAKAQIGLQYTIETAIRAATAEHKRVPNMSSFYVDTLRKACASGNLKEMCNLVDRLSISTLNEPNADGITAVDVALANNQMELVKILVLAGVNITPNLAKGPLGNLQVVKKCVDLSNQSLRYIPANFLTRCKHSEELDLSHNHLSHEFGDSQILKIQKLNLSHNTLLIFPFKPQAFPALRSINLAYNKLATLPDDLMTCLPNLEVLDVSYNLLESLQPDLGNIKDLDATGNPLSSILPAYRHEKDKIVFFLKVAKSQAMQPWNQVKLMLVGQEQVGKTSLLRALQEEKSSSPDAVRNVSTNGVTITTLNLSRPISSSLLPSLSSSKKPKGSQKERVRCNVWDFGGQSVFHSTHRFFITPFAVYVVLYDMSKPETCERLKYWLEQIGAYNDFEGTKPIVIVGTHADLLGKSEKERIMKNMDMLYPTMTPQKRNRTQVHGHYAVSLTDKQGLAELRDKLMDLVLSHPRVGVGQVQVPRSFVLMQRELEDVKLKTPYLRWSEYSALANSLDIGESSIPEITNILHDTGFVVWHNVPKLREIVVIDPQWLADAMAGVVTFICQITVSKQGGMIDWHKMRDSLRLKFPNPEVHSTVIYMLEFFEIIYKMRGIAISARSDVNSEQMYFVPSLLSSYVPSGEHPAIKFWHAMKPKHTYKRRFTWNFFPAGFFPRILLRLAHLRMRCVASWLDAAIIAGRHGDECAFLHLAHSRDDTFCLDVNVKAEESEPRNEEPLVAELAYVISRLHSDMYHLATGSIDLVHLVLISNEKGGPAAISRVGARFLSRSLETKNIYLVHVLDEKNDPAQQSPRRIDHARSASLGNTKDGSSFLPFEECIRSQMEGKTHILVEGRPTRISDIVPDMSGCNLIQDNDLAIEKKIGEGGFGVVYKGRLLRKGSLVDVAVKEMQKLYNKGAIYDFQHESVIMSKLKHVNLVQLYGITKTPLRMVLEYVPKSDLHELLMKKQILSVKWKLKMAIDCACGMRYLHSQTPPICHSDLRAPNIFVASLEEEESAVVGKVADFGLSQQVFPYSQQTLYNIVETAPETWEGGMYDEKSDVFSFAVILWRLFGSRVQYEPQHANGVAENGKKTDKAARNSLNDEDDEEFDYLKVDGKHVPPPKQRDLIRKGARPLIHTQCPSPLISLIKECWKTISETRPSFRTICEFLVRYYASLYGEDKYITQKQKEIGGIDLIDPVNTKETSPQSYFSANKWLPIEVTGTVTTILELPTEMWLGTSVGGLAMIDKQSTKIQKLIPSLSRQDLPSHLLSRKMPLILVDPNCVWAAVGNEIHILSTKTKSEIVATIVTNSPITAMLLIPDSMLVWVSDTDGYVTIWDGLSFQKCYRFKIHPQNCAHSMALLHSFVFVGVGKDLIAVHSRTLHVTQAEPTHGDRIQDILALPHTNQIWTCTRDGLVRLWRVTSVPLPASPNPSAPPTIAPPTPKPALPAAPSLPLLPRTPSKPTVTPARTSKSSLTISGSLLTTSGIALSIPALPSLSTSNHIKITMEKEWNMEVPVKCVGLLSDKGHVCAGTFHGTILLWNVQTLNQQEIQMPPNAQGHSVQSVLDTNSGLWCGLEGATHLLPSLRFQPAKKPTSKSSFFRTQSGGARLEGSATHTSDWKTQQESDE